jgi:hypothetical protein
MLEIGIMEKIQIYLHKEELDALRGAAVRARCSATDLIRDAIRKVIIRPQGEGPIAIWDGLPKRTSVEHD